MNILFFLLLFFTGAVFGVEKHDVVILGGGVSGRTAAIYLARAGFKPVVIEGDLPGGVLTYAHKVNNWPGEKEISGFNLVEKIKEQGLDLGVDFRLERVVRVDFSKRPFHIVTEEIISKKEHEIEAEICFVAMGRTPKKLNVKGEEEYLGKGISVCSVCDGALYSNKNVSVIGGGDTAISEMDYLANIAKKVYLVTRKGDIPITSLRPNVEIVNGAVTEEIVGDGEKVTGIVLNRSGNKKNLAVEAVFYAVGFEPNSSLFKDQLKLDEDGYIVVDKYEMSSIFGVYAIGDITNQPFKQALTAAADAVKAATSVKLDKKIKTAREIFSMDELSGELKSTKIPILVDCFATWCGPCQRVMPILDDAAKSMAGKALVLKANIEKSNVANNYDVRGVPTLLVFDANGKMVGRKIGWVDVSSFLIGLMKAEDVNEYLKSQF